MKATRRRPFHGLYTCPPLFPKYRSYRLPGREFFCSNTRKPAYGGPGKGYSRSRCPLSSVEQIWPAASCALGMVATRLQQLTRGPSGAYALGPAATRGRAVVSRPQGYFLRAAAKTGRRFLSPSPDALAQHLAEVDQVSR